MAMTLTSCFKDEAPNAECDITKAWVHVENPQGTFFHESDTVKTVMYSDSRIFFTVKPIADITALPLHFEITPGATVSPADGSPQDFSNGPVEYTVTSEDGQWQRKYTVSVLKYDMPGIQIPLEYDFENTQLFTANKRTYYKWYDECNVGGGTPMWQEVFSSANAGFALSTSTAPAEDYPSVSVDGYQGKGIRLTTCSTGSWGALMRRPLAAGNFFIGEFDVSVALTNTLHTTHMGRPFSYKPLKVTGMYKYKAGDVFWKFIDNKVEEHPEIKDRAAIYAVFYRNRDANGNDVMLYGDDSKTNPNIVGIAEMETIPETDSWTPFEISFRYSEDIDPELLLNQGYNLTIVFTSSTDGAYYEGAPGSTLCIDNVKITCE